MVWNTPKTDVVSALHATDWNAMVTAIQNQGSGYIISKSGTTYLANCLDSGQLLYAGTSFSQACMSCAADLVPTNACSNAYVVCAKASSADAFVIDATVDWGGKGIFFDGGHNQFDFHNLNDVCFKFAGTYPGENGMVKCGIANCELYGDLLKSSQMFATFEYCSPTITHLNASRDTVTRRIYGGINLLNNCYCNVITNCRFEAVIPIQIGSVCNATWIQFCDFGYLGSQNAIIITGGTPHTISDCYFENTIVPISISGGGDVHIRDNFIKTNTNGVGIDVSGNNTSVFIHNNDIVSTANADSVTGIRLTGVYYYGGQIHHNNIIFDGTQTNCVGINLAGVYNLNVSDNFILSYYTGCYGIKTTGTLADVLFSNNRIAGGAAATAGMSFQTLQQSQVVGNCVRSYTVALDCNTWNATECIIEGNYFGQGVCTIGGSAARVSTSDIIRTNSVTRSEFKGKVGMYTDGTNYFLHGYEGTNDRKVFMPVINTMGIATVSDGGTVTHNLGTTPLGVVVSPSVSSQFASVTAKAASTFTVAIKTDAGGAGSSQVISWMAWA